MFLKQVCNFSSKILMEILVRNPFSVALINVFQFFKNEIQMGSSSLCEIDSIFCCLQREVRFFSMFFLTFDRRDLSNESFFNNI